MVVVDWSTDGAQPLLSMSLATIVLFVNFSYYLIAWPFAFTNEPPIILVLAFKLCMLDWGKTLVVPDNLQYALLEIIAHINSED